ncbi:GFA family protein [Acanthopleuribacter pedis]|uniref:GFA family protein n=1 Tax=Acanthopleuribacter pedis TaxID=442870 RepID=A0A8J7QGD9_9BACT|nr:GFA family protein [Acanthopleuribacter pedis]MBO1318055.1 GFA family protein [Acanthopleuribacter pedis]
MGNHQGSCLCGAVSFEIEGDFEQFFLCHCSRCRKNSGSAHGANLFSSSATLIWRRGEDRVRDFHLPETRHTRSFCEICGSAMPQRISNDAVLMVPAGSLDSPITKQPDGHIFTADKAAWEETLSQCPRFNTFPGMD